jgi:GH24 family phage-related lysozyme (muramidase)
MTMTPDTLAEIKHRLGVNEGCRLTPYKDTMGIWTVGIGYNLEKGDRKSVCADLAKAGCISPESVIDSHAPITQAIADKLLGQILPIYIGGARDSLLPGVFEALSPARQCVLVDLEYNLGQRGWLGFVRTRVLINKAQHTKDMGNLAEAHKLFALVADALVCSDWAKQVGNRALRDEAMFKQGVFCSPTGDGSDILP